MKVAKVAKVLTLMAVVLMFGVCANAHIFRRVVRTRYVYTQPEPCGCEEVVLKVDEANGTVAPVGKVIREKTLLLERKIYREPDPVINDLPAKPEMKPFPEVEPEMNLQPEEVPEPQEKQSIIVMAGDLPVTK